MVLVAHTQRSVTGLLAHGFFCHGTRGTHTIFLSRYSCHTQFFVPVLVAHMIFVAVLVAHTHNFLSLYSWHTIFFCHSTRGTQTFSVMVPMAHTIFLSRYSWHTQVFYHDTRRTHNFSVTVFWYTIFLSRYPWYTQFSVTVPVAHIIFLSFVSDERNDWVCWEAKCAILLTSTALFVCILDVVDSKATSLWSGCPNYCGSISRNKFVSSPNGSKTSLGRTQVFIRWVMRLFFSPPGLY